MKNKKVLIISITVCVLLVAGIGFNTLFSNANKEADTSEVSSDTVILNKSEEYKTDKDKEDSDKEQEEPNALDKEDSDKEPSTLGEKESSEELEDKDKSNEEKSDSDTNISSSNKEESKNDTNSNNSNNSNTTTDTSKPNIEKPQKPQAQTVTIAISCKTAINNGVNKEDGFTHLPSDGVILQTTTVEIEEGESVFDVLKRIVKQNGIHMEYSGSGSSTYIEGIDNLYEFDGGQSSGWMYSVNGAYPNYGCDTYKLKPNDVIKWNYTCDLGVDLGAK